MNKYFSQLVFPFTFSIIIGCGQQETQSTDLLTQDSSSSQIEYDTTNLVYFDGDQEAYQQLQIHYMHGPPPENILFWSMIMAFKHGSSDANLDVYYSIYNGIFHTVFDTLFYIDPLTDSLMLSQLSYADSTDSRVIRAERLHHDRHDSLKFDLQGRKNYPDDPLNNDELSDFQNRMYWFGDTLAYRKIYEVYNSDGYNPHFLFWAMIMANMHDYHVAYLDVFNTYYSQLKLFEKKDAFEIDKRSDQFLRFYLKKAVQKGVEGSQDIMDEYNLNRLVN